MNWTSLDPPLETRSWGLWFSWVLAISIQNGWMLLYLVTVTCWKDICSYFFLWEIIFVAISKTGNSMPNRLLNLAAWQCDRYVSGFLSKNRFLVKISTADVSKLILKSQPCDRLHELWSRPWFGSPCQPAVTISSVSYIYIYIYVYIYIYMSPVPHPSHGMVPPTPRNLAFARYLQHLGGTASQSYCRLYTAFGGQPPICMLFAAVESHNLVTGSCLAAYFYPKPVYMLPVAYLTPDLPLIVCKLFLYIYIYTHTRTQAYLCIPKYTHIILYPLRLHAVCTHKYMCIDKYI